MAKVVRGSDGGWQGHFRGRLIAQSSEDEMKGEWAAVGVLTFPGWEAVVAAENKVTMGRTGEGRGGVREGVDTNSYWQWSHKKTNVYLNWVPAVAQISYSVSAVFFKFSQPHLSFCIMLYYFPALCQLKSLVFMPAACQALINISSAFFPWCLFTLWQGTFRHERIFLHRDRHDWGAEVGVGG